jgi:hypothetical protein
LASRGAGGAAGGLTVGVEAATDVGIGVETATEGALGVETATDWGVGEEAETAGSAALSRETAKNNTPAAIHKEADFLKNNPCSNNNKVAEKSVHYNKSPSRTLDGFWYPKCSLF